MSQHVTEKNNNWPGLDRGFNQRFVLHPGSSDQTDGVYIVSSSDDIITTLNSVHKESRIKPGELRMTSGGHCYENFTFQNHNNASGSKRVRIVINLGEMREIGVKSIAGADYITVEPGASNNIIQRSLHAKFGKALPGGSCYSVCAGGHIAGGGYGLLSRLHGLTVDYLAGVDMVTFNIKNDNFELRRFDPDNDTSSIDWACRGGGAGHFGIITKYYFKVDKVPASPENALLLTIPIPWSNIKTSDEFLGFLNTLYKSINSLIPQGFVLAKCSCKDGPSAAMHIVIHVVYGKSSGNINLSKDAAYKPIDRETARVAIKKFEDTFVKYAMLDGSKKSGEKVLLKGQPFNAALHTGLIYDLPYIDMEETLNGSGENQRGKYKSCYQVKEFTEHEASTLFEFLTAGSPPDCLDKSQTLVQIDSYGKAINLLDLQDADDPKTAVAARNSVLKLQYQTYWKDYEGKHEGDPKIVAWLNHHYKSIYSSHDLGTHGCPDWDSKHYQGCYFNYPDRQLGVKAGYEADPDSLTVDFETIYFGNKILEKLKKIKKDVDPGNMFQFSQSIKPAK